VPLDAKAAGAAALGTILALGGAYEVAVDDCVSTVYVDVVTDAKGNATKVQKIARCCGDGAKASSLDKCLPSTAAVVSVSAPKSKLLASSKLTLAAEELDSEFACACAPWEPAKESPCEVSVCALGGKDCKWVSAPTLSTLASGQWRGGCVKLATGCTISEVRDQCAPGDPCWLPVPCRDPKASAEKPSDGKLSPEPAEELKP
jgi:hypothetical protein